MDYTAIDTETANGKRASVCAIALIKVRDGVAVDGGYILVRPPEGFGYFHPRNIAVHSIYPGQVADARSWESVWGQAVEFIGDDVLVAHNASFDISVLQAACEVTGLPEPQVDYLCTLELSRRLLDLPNHRLPTVVREVTGADMADHHDVLADTRGVVSIMSGLSRLRPARDVRRFAQLSGVPLHTTKPARIDWDAAVAALDHDG